MSLRPKENTPLSQTERDQLAYAVDLLCDVHGFPRPTEDDGTDPLASVVTAAVFTAVRIRGDADALAMLAKCVLDTARQLRLRTRWRALKRLVFLMQPGASR